MRAYRSAGFFAGVLAAVWAGVPAPVMADCNGPACGEVGQRLDTFGVVVLIVILALFVLVMTVGARFVRPDRRPTD